MSNYNNQGNNKTEQNPNQTKPAHNDGRDEVQKKVAPTHEADFNDKQIKENDQKAPHKQTQAERDAGLMGTKTEAEKDACVTEPKAK